MLDTAGQCAILCAWRGTHTRCTLQHIDNLIHLIMHKNTQRCLFELAFALASDPANRDELECFGDMPEHLKDVIAEIMAGEHEDE